MSISVKRLSHLAPLIAGLGLVLAGQSIAQTLTTLHSFTTRVYVLLDQGGGWTNSDGAWPNGGLILSDNTLYGTAEQGGISGNGTMFTVNTDGSGLPRCSVSRHGIRIYLHGS